MEKTRVSIVSYLDSKPFLYGLKNAVISNEIELSLDIPSKSFEKAFNKALKFGIENLYGIIGMEKEKYQNVDIADYFAQNISFELDNEKEGGNEKFFGTFTKTRTC